MEGRSDGRSASRGTERERPSGDRAEDERRNRDEPATAEEREKEALDHQLDEELEDSFPASDPPSLTQDPR